MLNNLKRFFNSLQSQPQQDDSPDFKTSVAALLVEVMRADNELQEDERKAMVVLLQKYFDLGEEEVNNLITAASQDLDEAIDYFRFSKQINDNTNAQERIEIIELLWRLAYADGQLDKHEEHVIRRVADLLYVTHNDFIQAKLTATNVQS
ncbi:TerB family tellurite resistance protein [Pseudoalteromonas ruthenica]|uniref:tellurite resistance TerB family protein n=1 Tax=Pseudoalteromonas ruthenica TaxID=151081 RepID=UPI00241DC703|nr:TerB family tellurite resistance protein [Pseudoalteromonas ruthenica]|tara:strand:- start:4792 stop:5241 length:450 start_codon:yes stop_codon:yes gene_type:complete